MTKQIPFQSLTCLACCNPICPSKVLSKLKASVAKLVQRSWCCKSTELTNCPVAIPKFNPKRLTSKLKTYISQNVIYTRHEPIFIQKESTKYQVQKFNANFEIVCMRSPPTSHTNLHFRTTIFQMSLHWNCIWINELSRSPNRISCC